MQVEITCPIHSMSTLELKKGEGHGEFILFCGQCHVEDEEKQREDRNNFRKKRTL